MSESETPKPPLTQPLPTPPTNPPPPPPPLEPAEPAGPRTHVLDEVIHIGGAGSA